MTTPRPLTTFRIDLANGARLGPGKIELLELIASHGSIRAAGAAMGMSYRRAWMLCDEINRMFQCELVTTRHGGRAGGGATLTEFGQSLLDCARRIDAKAKAAIAGELDWLAASTNADFRSSVESTQD